MQPSRTNGAISKIDVVAVVKYLANDIMVVRSMTVRARVIDPNAPVAAGSTNRSVIDRYIGLNSILMLDSSSIRYVDTSTIVHCLFTPQQEIFTLNITESTAKISKTREK